MHERDLKEALIQGGRYYQEGCLWYCVKNCYVFVERTWLLAFFILLLSTVCTVGVNIYYLLPLKTTETFLRNTDSIGTEEAEAVRLYDIYKKNYDLQTVVDTYLISMYIQAWEDIKTGKEEEYRFIKLNSSYIVYEKLLESRTPESQKAGVATEIADVRIQKNVKTGGKVAVARIKFYKDDRVQEKTVKVTFRSTDVLLVHKNIASLELIVSGYEEIL